MNAVEKLEAAITRLEELRASPFIKDERQPTSDLIVTLHRTIDAQLALLRDGLAEVAWWVDVDSEWGWEPSDGPHPKSPAFANRLALADAILGGA